MLVFAFQKPGLYTTIQDEGRSGWQHLGVPIGGAMDRNAYRKANNTVGNPENSPCLEITMTGPEITVHGEGHIAITGADLSAEKNGEKIHLHTALAVSEGDILSFRKHVNGCRSYLAAAGEWDVPKWLGSCSPVTYAEFPDLPKKISVGTKIRINGRKITDKYRSKNKFKQPLQQANQIRVLPGPEFDWFSPDFQSTFFLASHMVGSQSNRMGYRLKSQLPDPGLNREMISSGVVPGTIQITREGLPIVLMYDAQTTGGYPRFGVVHSVDLPILAQAVPGTEVRFCKI